MNPRPICKRGVCFLICVSWVWKGWMGGHMCVCFPRLVEAPRFLPIFFLKVIFLETFLFYAFYGIFLGNLDVAEPMRLDLIYEICEI